MHERKRAVMNQTPEEIAQTVRNVVSTLSESGGLETSDQILGILAFVSGCEEKIIEKGTIDETDPYLFEVRSFKGALEELLRRL